jgi:hypothetical protein
MKKDFSNISIWKVYITLIVLTVFLTFSINYLFISSDLYYQSYAEQIATDRIAEMFEFSKKWQWLGYILIPPLVLTRISFTATCLYTGYFLANIAKVRFNNLFKIALVADFVFVLSAFIKLIILIFFKEVGTLDDLQFQPLSLMELFDQNSIDEFLIYPLSLINVFELLYCLTLAWLQTCIIEQSFGRSLKMVVSSYGTGLLLWALFIMFFTINLG